MLTSRQKDRTITALLSEILESIELLIDKTGDLLSKIDKNASDHEAEIIKLRAESEDIRKKYNNCLKELEARTGESEESRRINEKLGLIIAKLDNLAGEKAELAPPVFLPKHLEVDGERWGIQKKKVGGRLYYYANKRIQGKLYAVSLGRTFDEREAEKKIKAYKVKKEI